MATTKKKQNYWYVIVMTEEGPKFVTGTKYHTAYWDKEKTPLELGRDWAKDICMGLNLNGYLAYQVCMPFEIETHPYRYKDGHLEWVKGNEEEANEEKAE